MDFLHMKHTLAQTLATVLGPREAKLSFQLHLNNFFCNVAPLHLALALSTDHPGSLPGQSGPPEIKG